MGARGCAGVLAALNLLAGTGAVNPKRDLAAFPKTDLAFWITSDARLDTVGPCASSKAN
jgi:hypothetical protein